MQKKDLRVNQAYAIGSTSRFDRFGAQKATVIEVEGLRELRNGVSKRGIVIRVEEQKGGRSLSAIDMWPTTEDGVYVAKSARIFLSLWDSYAERKKQHEEARERSRVEQRRQLDVANSTVETLRELGLDVSTGFGASRSEDGIHLSTHGDRPMWSITADGMHKLIEELRDQ